MPEPSPAEPPSRWTVINDYSKTVITVCAALLAFIGAFASKLPDEQLSMGAIWIGCITVALLCLAALCSLAVPGMLDRYLRIAAKGKPKAVSVQNGGEPAAEEEKTAWPAEKNPDTATQKEWSSRPAMIWKTKAAANLSYLFLALAVIGLAVFAIYQSVQPPKKNVQGEQPHVGPSSPPAHYEMVYSAVHHTRHGQEAHTFLLDQTTGDLWQMVCSVDGVVSFRRIRRLDVNGKVEAQASVAVQPTTGP
jgi:hypothetical protein